MTSCQRLLAAWCRHSTEPVDTRSLANQLCVIVLFYSDTHFTPDETNLQLDHTAAHHGVETPSVPFCS